jgi:hypothetical protein
VSDLLTHGRNRDGLFQDGTKGRIMRNDGILEIADDQTSAVRKASRMDSTTGCYFMSCSNVQSWETASF